MNRIQKVLAAAIVIELAALGFAWRWHSRLALLPPLDWSACLIDSGAASEIRAMGKALQPKDPASWFDLASAYRAYGLFPQAEFCYRRLDALQPDDPSYLYYWAQNLDLMGRTQEASKLYQKIIDDRLIVPMGDKTIPYCWLNLGEDRLREENVPAAIDDLKRAGDIPKAKFLLSRVLIRSGRAEEAVPILDELMAQDPTILDYSQMKSWAEQALGNTEAAEDCYERSLRSPEMQPKMDPSYYKETLPRRFGMGSEAWFRKGLQLERDGKYDEALQWSHKAIDACWSEARAQLVARLELRMGHYREAIDLAEAAARRAGASADMLDIVGVASIKLNDLTTARHAWEQAVQIYPTPGYYSKLAQLAADAQEKKKYEALALYQSGKQAWLVNDLKAARDHFEQAVTLWDGHAHTWFYLGETRRLQGDFAGAEAAYRRCLQINPDYGRAISALDRMKAKMGAPASPGK